MLQTPRAAQARDNTPRGGPYARISNLTIPVLVVAISTLIRPCVSESADPRDPKFSHAFAREIRLGSRLRSMTPVAIQSRRARDRPMYMQNASVVLAPPTTTTAVAVAPSEAHTAVAVPSTWTICEGTHPRLPSCRRCTCSLGRGSVHSVGVADSVVASKSKDDRAGLRGPLLLVIHGVLSPERRCRRQMNPGWTSGHGAVRCAHSVNGD